MDVIIYIPNIKLTIYLQEDKSQSSDEDKSVENENFTGVKSKPKKPQVIILNIFGIILKMLNLLYIQIRF